MKRYHFDTREGLKVYRDEDGADFSTLDAVLTEATLVLADRAKDFITKHQGHNTDMAVEVRDETGPVMEVKFSFKVDHHRH